jgi:hypothetical protein
MKKTCRVHTLSHHTHKCNFIYACMKSTPCTNFPPTELRLEPSCLILPYLNKCRKWRFSGNSQSVNQSAPAQNSHQTKNAENAGKISFMPWNKVCFRMHIFSQTHNHSMTLHGDVLYWISPTSIKKYIKYGGKFSYGLKQNRTVPFLMKFKLAWQPFVKNSFSSVLWQSTEH